MIKKLWVKILAIVLVGLMALSSVTIAISILAQMLIG